MVDKSTKCCELTVHMCTGACISGTFHIPFGTSSAIRPSDALRDCKGGFVVLSNATVRDKEQSVLHRSVMIRVEAVSHIELPEKGWGTRELK